MEEMRFFYQILPFWRKNPSKNIIFDLKTVPTCVGGHSFVNAKAKWMIIMGDRK